jgi:hypothetical protein
MQEPGRDAKGLPCVSSSACTRVAREVDSIRFRQDVCGPIHSNKNARCITLANNSTLIAVSAGSSVSFWDTTTREQIGSAIEFTHDVWSMVISVNCDLATFFPNQNRALMPSCKQESANESTTEAGEVGTEVDDSAWY